MKNDFREEVDAMRKKDSEKNKAHLEKNNQVMEHGKSLVHEMRKWHDNINKIYAEAGIRLNGKNPTFFLKKQLPMVDELARMAYDTEIKYWESKGLKPQKGWHEFGSSTNNTTEQEIKNLFSKNKNSATSTATLTTNKKRVKRIKL